MALWNWQERELWHFRNVVTMRNQKTSYLKNAILEKEYEKYMSLGKIRGSCYEGGDSECLINYLTIV